MTRDDIFALALALPDTVRGTSYGHACVKLRDKPLVGDCREPDVMALHVDLETVERLVAVQPATFFQTPHFAGWPTVLVRPAAADPVQLTALVEQAWARRASVAQRRARDRTEG